MSTDVDGTDSDAHARSRWKKKTPQPAAATNAKLPRKLHATTTVLAPIRLDLTTILEWAEEEAVIRMKEEEGGRGRKGRGV
jgi:hypothetical protein